MNGRLRFISSAAVIWSDVDGSADGIETEQVVDKLRSGVDGGPVGRGALRNPWILAQAKELAAGRPARDVTHDDRGRFLLDYIDMLKHERVDETRATSHDKWIVNKLRALASWYTKGLDNGSHLRTAINSAGSLDQLREIILNFFSPARFALHV